MKNLISLIFAGMIGGGLVLGIHSFTQTSPQIHSAETIQAVPVANYTTSNSAPFDFVKASAISTPAVVHINVEESDALAQNRIDQMKKQRRNDPFADFFGGGVFEDYFGQNFHKQKGSGSGVIVSDDGYIVTNNHVVGFGDKIGITLSDGRKYSAVKIGTDPNSDLAVLKIEGNNLPTLGFANSDNVKIGEWVIAVGNPFDYLTSTVTAGIVSAKGRDINIIKGNKPIEEFIQTDAAVNPGNSGGALVDVQGNLIGINTAIATPTGVYAGYSFAIPSNLVRRIVDEIIENGDIERANLGIYISELDDMRKEGVEPGFSYGAYVNEVINRSSAQFAGLLPGDIIINVDGEEVRSGDDLIKNIKFLKVGDTIRLKVIRKGQEKTIDIKMRRGV